jgi:hypothetical protein
MLVEAPAFYSEDAVRIGGPGWFAYDKDGQRHYTRLRQVPDKGGRNTRRADRLKDVQEDNLAREDFVLNPARSDDARTIKFVHEMLSADVNGSDNRISVPAFYTQKPHHSYLRLRAGRALYERVQMCAETGEWGLDTIMTMCAEDRGVARRVGSKEIELKVDYKIDHDEEDLGELARQGRVVRGTDKISVFHKVTDPTDDVVREIFSVFGVNRGLELEPVIADGQSLRVCAGQTLWVPIPRGQYSLEALRKRDDFEALCYLAALHHKTNHEGVGEFFNLEYVHASGEVFADMNSIQNITKVRVVNTAGKFVPEVALVSRGSDHIADLMCTTSRDEINKSKERRAQAEAKAKAEEKQKRFEARRAAAKKVPEKEAVQPPVEQPRDVVTAGSSGEPLP